MAKGFRRICLLSLLGILFPISAFGSRAEEMVALLTKVDYILSPKGSYEYPAEIKVERGGKVAEEREFQVYVQDPLHRRINIEKPEAEEGKSLLLEGDGVWLYIPKLKKSVRIPPQVNFAGEVSSIDLAQPYFSIGYQVIGMESADWQGEPAQVLTLIPRTKTSAYARVKLWAWADGSPIQTEFFNSKKQLAKTCTYEDFREELGAKRPLRWVYREAASENQTVLTMGKIARVNFDPKAFQAGADLDLISSPQARPSPASGQTPPRRRAGR